jgi:hypothetical protein
MPKKNGENWKQRTLSKFFADLPIHNHTNTPTCPTIQHRGATPTHYLLLVSTLLLPHALYMLQCCDIEVQESPDAVRKARLLALVQGTTLDR